MKKGLQDRYLERNVKEGDDIKESKKSSSVLFADRIRELDKDLYDKVFTSENMDTGNSRADVTQLSYEEIIKDRLDKYELDSLLKLKAN